MRRRRGSRSENCAQWGLSLLGAMLLANPLTPALTWRMPQPLHAPDTVGREAVLNINQLLASQQAVRNSCRKQHSSKLLWVLDFEYYQKRGREKDEMILTHDRQWNSFRSDCRGNKFIPKKSIQLGAGGSFLFTLPMVWIMGYKLLPCIIVLSSSS